MIEFGMEQKIHVTGSTHKSNGMRDVASQDVHDELIRRIYKKIDSNRNEIVKYEEHFTDDMDYLVVSYGAASRPSLGAVHIMREKGLKIGFLRLITIWPFADTIVKKLCSQAKKIFVPEMNLGQISREIERFTSNEVISISKIGGISHTTKEIIDGVEENI